MEDLACTQKPTQNKPQTISPSSAKYNFEEELKRQNINTMIEIYGEEYMEKIETLME